MIELAIYAAGMALVFAELFVPGAVLGLIGGSMVLYALAATWWKGDTSVAIPMTLLTIVAIPMMISFAVRRLSLRDRLDAGDDGRSTSERPEIAVGAEGVAVTPLRPSGTARFGERRESVVAESGMIEKDARVRAIKVEGYRIVVRAI